MARKNQIVMRHPEGWGVKGEGNSRFTKVFARQWEAIEFGKEVAMNQRSILIVYNRKGVERDRMDYTHYRPYVPTYSYSWQNYNFQSSTPVMQSLSPTTELEPANSDEGVEQLELPLQC